MTATDADRWKELTGGYRTPFDPRPLIARLESEADSIATWQLLWKELHHQGDVGGASYAAVPLLVAAHRRRRMNDWNTYAIVAVIELARTAQHNPPLPEWLFDEYFEALQQLAEIGAHEIISADGIEGTRAILSLIAVAKGLRTHGRFLIEYSAEELLEFKLRT
jgi:hypothetical protein